MNVYKVVHKKRNSHYYYSVAGVVLSYEIGKWTKPGQDSYLYVYESIDNAIKLLQVLETMYRRKDYCILECEAKDITLHALDGVWAFHDKRGVETEIPIPGHEYRCSEVKPIREVKLEVIG